MRSQKPEARSQKPEGLLPARMWSGGHPFGRGSGGTHSGGLLNYALFSLLSFAFCLFNCSAQQLPYYTQFKSNAMLLNPAISGTKRIFDARLNYRMQWVGFEDAPVTQAISLNGKLMKGTMGTGATFFLDKTGPTQRTNFSFVYSYHILFDDVELSLGMAGHVLSYLVSGTKLFMHIPYDNTIDLTALQKKTVYDASAGALFYNDRFHLGLSVLNLSEPSVNYYPKDDTVHKTNIGLAPHGYGSVGYNWSGQEDWIWENSLQMAYTRANPITLDYNLRLHYKRRMFAGVSLRLRDALAFHLGASFLNEVQVSYSYDFMVSPLRSFQSGSHEIMLVWSSNLGLEKKKKYLLREFKRQKYGYMF